ncbi:MAG: pneumococcal-type histidine triad protein [Flavobacteriaceae bacterium]|nr:pneumococcal-type histidine triad protein [Flavobacteriaceae bacterium]
MKINKKFLILLFIWFIFGCSKKENIINVPLSKAEIKFKAETLLSGKELEFKNEKVFIIENTKEHIFLINGNEYIYIDLSGEKAMVYKLKTKGLVTVQIVETLEDGYVVNHDGHFDFIYGELPKGKKIGDYIDIIDPHLSSSNEDKEKKYFDEKNKEKIELKEKNNDTKQNKQKKTENSKSENIIYIENNDNYVFDIKDVVRETENGYLVKHGNHYHFIYKEKNSTSNTPSNKPTNENILKKYEKQIEYIANLNGLKKEDIRIEGDLLIYPHDNHEHALELSKIEIPKMSNDLENDFEMELEALSKLTNTPIDNIIISDGFMKIIHGDHSHTYKIKSPGWIEYLKNKIPNIKSNYISGPLNRDKITEEVNALLEKAKIKHKNDEKQFKRIERVLRVFMNEIAWGDNSTEGYLSALAEFEKKYINTNKPIIEDNNVSILSYNEIIKKIEVIKNNLHPADEKFNQYIVLINNIELEASYKSKSEKELTIEITKLEENLNKNFHENNKSLFDQKYDEIYRSIKSLDEDKYLKLKVYLLNKLDSIEKIENNIYLLEALKEEIQPNIIENNKTDELIHYIQSNKNDQRLDEEEKNHIQESMSDLDNLSVEKLLEIKLLIKNSFKRYENEENKYSTKIIQILDQSKTILENIDDTNLKVSLLGEFESIQKQINETSQKKELYQKAVAFLNKLQQVPKKEINHSDNVPNISMHEAEDILIFIEENKRKMLDGKEKVALLNEFYDLQEKFENKTLDKEHMIRLEELKTQAEDLIKKNTAPISENDYSGW